ISNHFRAVIVETQPIDQRAFFWITKDARARIARLRLCGHCSNFNKEKHERLPRWYRDAIFVQTGGEPDAMPEIQSEHRHRRGFFSCLWKRRPSGGQKREREGMRGFGGERKKKGTQKALVNHLLARIIRIICRCKTDRRWHRAPLPRLHHPVVHRWRAALPANRLQTFPASLRRRSRPSPVRSHSRPNATAPDDVH